MGIAIRQALLFSAPQNHICFYITLPVHSIKYYLCGNKVTVEVEVIKHLLPCGRVGESCECDLVLIVMWLLVSSTKKQLSI